MTPARFTPVALTHAGLVCAAGVGLPALADALRTQRSGLTANPAADTSAPSVSETGHADQLSLTPPGQAALPTWLGRVAGLEQQPLPPALVHWDSRATRLAWAGLQADGFAAAVQAVRERAGAPRIGLLLGTSAATIGASEAAYRTLMPDGSFPPALRSPRLNTPHALALFVADALGLQGPACTVSTACSSSAKVFAQGERWLRLGLVDAVVLGGVDALSASMLYGFHALGLTSPQPCQPFDAARCGISVGEAAGFVLLQRAADVQASHTPALAWLWGHGESNDAHHMSSPHPQGLGAELALDAALARAGLAASDIHYLNLHGTASPQNDAVEAALVARRYRPDVHASATKGCTGHTMGAAGLLGALACSLALHDGLASGSAQLVEVDPRLGPVFAAQLQRQPQTHAPGRLRFAASHAFGFGGNNAVLVFGHAPH